MLFRENNRNFFLYLQTTAEQRVRAVQSELDTARSIHEKESRNADERYNQLNDDFRKLMSTVSDKNHVSVKFESSSLSCV